MTHLLVAIAEFGSLERHTMLRLIITVLLGGIIHGVGCIITPPFEFGKDRPTEFFWGLISGFILTSVLVAVLFWPLRTALRRWMPRRTARTHAIVAAAVLVGFATALAIWRVLSHHQF